MTLSDAQGLTNDEPTLLDTLKHRDLLIRVAGEVATCQPPLAIGLHGDWGTGKTSFLQQLRFLVSECSPMHDAQHCEVARRSGLRPNGDEYRHVVVAWFEAWRYQHESAPIVALLQELRAQLSLAQRTLARTKKLAEIATESALLALDDFAPKLAGHARKVGERWERENMTSALPADLVRRHLQFVIGQLLPTRRNGPTARLLVIIDDLDRCEPQTAYRLLEGIKIYLSLPNCVFVIGMNQRIVEEALAQQVPSADGRSRRAREYLEKICQRIVHLPLATETGDLIACSPRQLHPALKKVLTQAHCIPPNPRRAKALLNIVRAESERHLGVRDDPSVDRAAQLIVIFASLYLFHPDVYRLVEHQPTFFKELCQHAGGSTRDNPTLKTLALLEAKSMEEKRAPGNAVTFVARHPDPADRDVLWIQPLLKALLEDPVTEEEVRMHLLR